MAVTRREGNDEHRRKAAPEKASAKAETSSELSEGQIADLVEDAKTFKGRHDRTFRILAGKE